MTKELSIFATRLRDAIASGFRPENFPALALELFTLQFQHNLAYQKICRARSLTPANVTDWTQVPAVPTSAFKELELTALALSERTAVFHSSGTTEQKPSRHFHNADSLALYEKSLWAAFDQIFQLSTFNFQLCVLTPPANQVPHSSLVHMFEVVRKKLAQPPEVFLGHLADDGTWQLDFPAALAALSSNSKLKTQNSKLILGTAFSFVHLLDFLAEKNLRLALPPGSRVLETGGYKNRSRSMPKPELHALIADRLGVARENIVCEYGMSELSSQAYETRIQNSESRIQNRAFQFPPWARAQIVSPETGRAVADGETGLLRLCDLANVFSVQAIQTEDLAIRRGEGFELLGRAQLAEPRGCSLMTA
ncbi:MAG: hypothetical protein RLZZ350_2374 [Verrucomicrobiota bacterium]|jgi:hypothetical protein